MESGTVLTCYEDSLGPTNINFNMAYYACNYTQEMWDSKNYTGLKECLMKISVADGLEAAFVKFSKNTLYLFIEMESRKFCMLEYGSG